VISIVACCYSVKLCALSAQAFRSQDNAYVIHFIEKNTSMQFVVSDAPMIVLFVILSKHFYVELLN